MERRSSRRRRRSAQNGRALKNYCLICSDAEAAEVLQPPDFGNGWNRTEKGFRVLCDLLNVKYRPSDGLALSQSLCQSCTTSVNHIMELHEQLEVLGVKLQILLEGVCKRAI